CSLIALAVTLSEARFDSDLRFTHLVLFLGAVFLSVTIIVTLSVWKGSSLLALVSWLVLKPRQIMGPLWYLAPEASLFRTLAAIAGVGLAIAVRNRLIVGQMIMGMKVTFGVGILALALAHRPGAVMTLGAPFLWVCVISDPWNLAEQKLERIVLCLVAVA